MDEQRLGRGSPKSSDKVEPGKGKETHELTYYRLPHSYATDIQPSMGMLSDIIWDGLNTLHLVKLVPNTHYAYSRQSTCLAKQCITIAQEVKRVADSGKTPTVDTTAYIERVTISSRPLWLTCAQGSSMLLGCHDQGCPVSPRANGQPGQVRVASTPLSAGLALTVPSSTENERRAALRKEGLDRVTLDKVFGDSKDSIVRLYGSPRLILSDVSRFDPGDVSSSLAD